MKRIALAAVAAFAFVGTATAAPLQSTTTPKVIRPHAQCPLRPAQEQRRLAAQTLQDARWRHPSVPAWTSARIRVLRSCGAPAAPWQRAKRNLYRYSALRHVAPYPGGGSYWAVPYCIVYAESGGSWTAHNPSSPAKGPYEIEEEVPYPAVTWQQKMANHRAAARIWAEQGPDAWTTAAGCGY